MTWLRSRWISCCTKIVKRTVQSFHNLLQNRIKTLLLIPISHTDCLAYVWCTELVLSVLVIWLLVPSILLLKGQSTPKSIFLCFCSDFSFTELTQSSVGCLLAIAPLKLNCSFKISFNYFNYTERNQFVFSRRYIRQNIDIYALGLNFHAFC